MEVRKGYKQTDIGIIPSDWEIDVIAKIGTINGRVGWKGYTKKDLRDNGPFTIGAKHIDNSNRLDLSDPTCISIEKFIESPEIMVLKGDILIVQRGTIGKVMVIDKEIGDATINPSMLILRLKIIPPKYGFYYLISNSGQNQILADTSSTGVPMITQKQVLNFQIPHPPTKSEQTAIATALSDADALITSLEKLIAKKRLIKQGAMQELLSLTGSDGKPKEGWVFEKVKNIAFITTGSKNTQDKIDDGLYPFFVRSDKIERINSFSYDGEAVLVAGDGVGTGKVVNYYKGKLDFHQRVYKISDFHNGINGFFFYLYFKNNFFERVMQMTAKSSVDSVRMEMISEMNIHFPLIEEQTRIANILSDMDAEITTVETKLEKYRKIKLGMMQELLTGKIRLA